MRYLIIVFILFGNFKAYSIENSKDDSPTSSRNDSLESSFPTSPHNDSLESSYDYSTVNPYSFLSDHEKEQLEQTKQAVWKIKGPFSSGTAFFISPNRIITNWHVISSGVVFGKSLSTIFLQREEAGQKLYVKKLISVSIYHDLVLLEVDGDSDSHLSLIKETVSDEKKLFVLGYPGGNFRYTLKTSPFKVLDDFYTDFFVNFTNLNGNSGGPVLSVNKELIGVIAFSFNNLNYAGMIKGDILRKFISADIGTSCEGQIPLVCVREEMRKLRKLAEQGDSIAQYELAKIYYDGKIVEQNFRSAFEWATRSALRGHVRSQRLLGVMYAKGKGVKQNFSLALKWYHRVAVQGYASAQHDLGVMYYEGNGVERNPSLAFHWFHRSAEQGNVFSQHNLGTMYYNGDGVERNPSLAIHWFHRSAEQGHTSSQHLLGMMYYEGNGVEQNSPLAFHWFHRAAEQSHPEAQYSLGMMYYNGIGVKRNLSLALYWFHRSAEQGHVFAQYNLGTIYYHGEEAVVQNLSLAEKWFLHSAEQGNPLAQYNLGVMYYKGEGVKQNFPLAFEWFYIAAIQGDMEAQHSLGIMYYKGEGVEQDSFLALKWFGFSADQGHVESLNYLKEIWTVKQENFSGEKRSSHSSTQVNECARSFNSDKDGSGK